MQLVTEDQDFLPLVESLSDVKDKSTAVQLLKDKGLHGFIVEDHDGVLQVKKILLG
jgi:hypothetical protein